MSAAPPQLGRSFAALTIGRARLHGAAAGDLPRLRDRLDDVRPSAIGLPDRAILLIPRLAIGRRLARARDGGGFADAVTDELRAALRRARRPGAPGSADDPLLFLDESEAAAALIGQWLEGVPASDRCWWPLLTAGAAPALWWRRRLLPDARRLPAVVALLAHRGLAAAWLRRLEPQEIEIAVAAMAASHGLARREWRRRRRGGSAGPDTGAPEAVVPETVAWVDAIAPEARQGDLSSPARLLLILTLVAERRPALLTTRAAQAAFVAAASGRLPGVSEPAPKPPRRPPLAVAKRSPSPPARAGRAEPRRLAPKLRGRPAIRPGAAALPVARAAAARAPALDGRPAAGVDRLAPPLAEAASPTVDTETAFGGLLFLLNALLALGLYGDFSRLDRAVAGLSPFGLLRLLGRAWFGRRFVDDPLNGLLVRLAGGGRADAPSDFEAPPWSVPRAWLSPWAAAGPPMVGGHRLRSMLWHAAGFPLAELNPQDAAAAVRAARRLGLRGQPRRARRPSLPATVRARWIACLRLYLEARLARTLGCPDGEAAVAMLCQRPARIAVEGETLTARFTLEDHPIAIRLAGLDRDPGWIPAARRSFRYLFE